MLFEGIMKEIVQSSFYDSNALIPFKNIKYWRKFEIEEICEGIILGKVEDTVSGGDRVADASSVHARRQPWDHVGT